METVPDTFGIGTREIPLVVAPFLGPNDDLGPGGSAAGLT